MIGIAGDSSGNVARFIMTLNLGGVKDAIDTAELVNFIVWQEAGNVLPTCKLTFKTDKPEVIKAALGEKCLIEGSFGRNLDTQYQFKFRAFKSIPMPLFEVRRMYFFTIYGILDNREYLVNDKVRSFSKKRSDEVFQSIAEEQGFTYTADDVEDMNDKMTWLQCGVSDKKMVDDVWMHSYHDEQIIVPGIGIDQQGNGEFFLIDLKKQFEKADKVKVGMDVETKYIDSDKFINVGLSDVTSNAGFYNSWTAGRSAPFWSVPSYDSQEASENVQPVGSIEMDRVVTGSSKFRETTQTHNTHENWVKAKNRNLLNLASFSTIQLTCIANDTILPDLKLFDPVTFITYEPNYDISMEPLSGKYLTTKIVWGITQSSITSTFMFCRQGYQRGK